MENCESTHDWKQKDNHNINKLRRLNIFESDYNALLKYFWPHNANKNNGTKINMGNIQYECFKGLKVNETATINEFIIDFHHMSHRPLTIVQKDLKSWFDRTVQKIFDICNRRMSVPKKVCHLTTQTIKWTKYYITTANGTSKTLYQSTKNTSIHGSIQG